MIPFQPILDRALDRKGGPSVVDPLLPVARPSVEIRQEADSDLFALMTQRLFSAGFRRSVVVQKWAGFEELFCDFDPERVQELGPDEMAAIAQDTRIIRNKPKIHATRANAEAICGLYSEGTSLAGLIADWPVTDIVGLWAELAQRFQQMGGMSGPYFLRMVGKDTFLLTGDVNKALVQDGVVEGSTNGKRAKAKVQAAFNHWMEETGWPLCQLSRVLALSVD